MAQYEVLDDIVMKSGRVKKGAIIEYDGKSEGTPGPNFKLIKAPVKTKKAVDGGVDDQDSVAGGAGQLSLNGEGE